MSKMRVHKQVLIRLLHEHTEEVRELIPGYEGTAQEAIRFLESDPREWLDEFSGDEPQDKKGGAS